MPMPGCDPASAATRGPLSGSATSASQSFASSAPVGATEQVDLGIDDHLDPWIVGEQPRDLVRQVTHRIGSGGRRRLDHGEHPRTCHETNLALLWTGRERSAAPSVPQPGSDTVRPLVRAPVRLEVRRHAGLVDLDHESRRRSRPAGRRSPRRSRSPRGRARPTAAWSRSARRPPAAHPSAVRKSGKQSLMMDAADPVRVPAEEGRGTSIAGPAEVTGVRAEADHVRPELVEQPRDLAARSRTPRRRGSDAAVGSPSTASTSQTTPAALDGQRAAGPRRTRRRLPAAPSGPARPSRTPSSDPCRARVWSRRTAWPDSSSSEMLDRLVERRAEQAERTGPARSPPIHAEILRCRSSRRARGLDRGRPDRGEVRERRSNTSRALPALLQRDRVDSTRRGAAPVTTASPGVRSRRLVDAGDDRDGLPVGLELDPDLSLAGERVQEVLVLTRDARRPPARPGLHRRPFAAPDASGKSATWLIEEFAEPYDRSSASVSDGVRG